MHEYIDMHQQFYFGAVLPHLTVYLISGFIKAKHKSLLFFSFRPLQGNIRANPSGAGGGEEENRGPPLLHIPRRRGAEAVAGSARAGAQVRWCHHAILGHRGLYGRVCPVHAHAGHLHAEWTVHALRLPVRHPGCL